MHYLERIPYQCDDCWFNVKGVCKNEYVPEHDSSKSVNDLPKTHCAAQVWKRAPKPINIKE